MLRILTVLFFGYCAYRISREFIDSVPDDFDIVAPPEPVPVPVRRDNTVAARTTGIDSGH